VRYWLPFYSVLSLLAVYCVSSLKDQSVKLLLVGGLLVTGPLSVWTILDGSLVEGRDTLIAYNEWGRNELTVHTEEDALIYASLSDKRIAPFRDVATWWNGSEFYDPPVLAASVARVVPTGRPIYVFREREVNISEVNAALAHYNLTTRWVPSTRLYKVAELQSQ
jgi:hypothetical protein